MNSALMFMLFLVLLALTAFFNLAEMALVAARASKLESAGNAKAAENVVTLRKRSSKLGFATEQLIAALRY
jgi:CBS domain containing-hemolysin-like protein